MIGFTIPLVLFFGILFFFPARYAGNDDLTIVGILSGKDGFPPDNFVYFISAIMSNLLYFLYKHFPSIPWYGLTIILISYLGVSLVLSVIIRCTIKDKISLVLAIPAFLIFFTYCSFYVTFTTATLLMEFGVLLSLLEWQVREKAPVKHARHYGLLLVFCFLLALSLRWKVVLYSLVFGLPSLLFLKKSHVKSFVLMGAIILLIVAINRSLFWGSTDTPQIEQFAKFNELGAEFYDSIKGDDHGYITQEALKKVAWTYDDYLFFRLLWNVYDETAFNYDTLKIFLKENHPLRRGSQHNWKRFIVEFSYNGGYAYIFILTLLSLLVWRFSTLINLSKQNRVKVLISFCLLLAISALLMIIRYRMHVFGPIFGYLICIFLLLSHINEPSAKRMEEFPPVKSFTVIILVLLFFGEVGACYSTGKQEFRRLANSLSEKNYARKCLQTVKAQYPSLDFMVIMSPPMPTSLLFETVHPLREFSDFPELKIFPNGWQVNSPRYFSILQEMHLKSGHDFLARVASSKNVLFVLFVRDSKQYRVIKSLWESYVNRRIMPNAHLSLTPVYDFRENEHYGLIFYRWTGSY